MITALHERHPPFNMVDGANTYAIFAIEDGQVKIVNAKISQANIDNLVVGTSNILPGAITSAEVTEGGVAGNASPAGSYSNFDFTVNHGLGSPIVKIELTLIHNYTNPSGNTAGWFISSATDGGRTLDSGAGSIGAPPRLYIAVIFRPPADRDYTVFRVGTTIFGGGTEYSRRTAVAYVFKR